MIPRMEIVIDMPAILDDGARFKRDHNRWVKAALGREMKIHHKKRIRLHFRQDARSKYGYKPRKPGYLKMKRRVFRSARDLVMTGISEKKFKAGYDKLSLSGKAVDGKVTGTLLYKWPFDLSRRNNGSSRRSRSRGVPTAGVTVQQMSAEMEAFTEPERNEVAVSFTAEYMRLMNAGLKPRVRKKILAANSGALG